MIVPSWRCMYPMALGCQERRTAMALDSHQTALLVIDVQNEYFDGKWPIPDGTAALTHIEEAIDASHKAGAKVIYVQHAVLRPEREVFVPGSPGFELHPRLHPRAAEPRL